MELAYRRVGPGASLDLASEAFDPVNATAVRGRGRGSAVRVPSGPLTLWFCLSGALELDTADGPFVLRARQCLALPGTGATRALAREAGDWAVVALPAAVAARIGAGTGVERLRRADPPLFPVKVKLSRSLLRALVALQRHATAANPHDARLPLEAVLHAAERAQRPQIDAWIQRANGRSLRHRRQVVQRLLSARNRILNTPFDTHDLETLAAAARYSKSHFLRMFRDVFGSTPHELVISARMELAKDLIAHSDLAISEIAASVGYDSRFAFARLFKKRVGMTASDYRQDGFAEMRHAA